MNCRNCGKQLDDGAKFCAFCGASQAEDSSVDDGVPSSDETKTEEVCVDDESPEVVKDCVSEEERKQGRKKSILFFAKWAGIYIVLAAVLFFIAVALSIAGSQAASYRFVLLTSIAVYAAVPYAIAILVLALIGKRKRDSAWNAVKSFAKKRPPVFAGCSAALALVLSACLFVASSCPHDNLSPATCTTPKTCNDCGEVEGEALGHKWVDATCTTPKTCSRCGETMGEAKGHTPGDWGKEETDYVAATVTTKQLCEDCGETVDSKSEQITSFVDGEVFSIPANDFIKRMDRAYSTIPGCSLKAKSGALKDNLTLSLDVKSGSSTVAAAGFVKAGSKSSLVTLAFGSGEGQYWQVLFSFSNSNSSSDYAAETMYALIQTCDPSLTKDEAHDVGSEVIANYESLGSGKGMGQATRNGITYSLANSNGWMVSAKIG